MHILAHSGPGHHWVTLPPLKHKNWNMPALEWSTATRRRLGIDVIPTERQCSFCLWDRCDTKGNHATMCTGGASCILRHNEIRGILAKAIHDTGFQVGYRKGVAFPVGYKKEPQPRSGYRKDRIPSKLYSWLVFQQVKTRRIHSQVIQFQVLYEESVLVVDFYFSCPY